MEFDFDAPSFTHLLQSGELGKLKLGLSSERILDLLGEPLVSGAPAVKKDRLRNFIYDHLLISLYNDELILFQIHFEDYFQGPLSKQATGLPSVLQADWYSQVKQMNIHDFIRYIKQRNITCRRLATDERNVLWLEQSQLELTFDGELPHILYITASYSGVGNRLFQEC